MDCRDLVGVIERISQGTSPYEMIVRYNGRNWTWRIVKGDFLNNPTPSKFTALERVKST